LKEKQTSSTATKENRGKKKKGGGDRGGQTRVKQGKNTETSKDGGFPKRQKEPIDSKKNRATGAHRQKLRVKAFLTFKQLGR